MTAKEYLSQAYCLDQQINMKLEQLEPLKALATKATSVLSGSPGCTGLGGSLMADMVVKIVDLDAEINRDVDRFVALREEIRQRIQMVKIPIYRELLTYRYSNLQPWDAIAAKTGYSVRRIYTLHQEALAAFEKECSQ